MFLSNIAAKRNIFLLETYRFMNDFDASEEKYGEYSTLRELVIAGINFYNLRIVFDLTKSLIPSKVAGN